MWIIYSKIERRQSVRNHKFYHYFWAVFASLMLFTTPMSVQAENAQTEPVVASEEVAIPEMEGEDLTPAESSSDEADEKVVEERGIQDPDVTIVHTNDMHGRIESTDREIGIGKVKTYVEETKPDLVLDGGDAFQGLPISNSDNGKTMADLMNEVGYDAMVVGNHEFDFGYENALAYQKLLNFPILSANVYKDGERVFQPYTVIEKNNRKYGIIGLTTPETATKTHPKNVEGVEFRNPIAEGLEQFSALADKMVDTYIYLVHLGIDNETNPQWRGDSLAKVLAERHGDAQIMVIDGHSHTKKAMRFGNVLYSQTGSHLANIGNIALKGKDADYQAEAYYVSAEELKDLEVNSKVKEIIEAAREEYDRVNAEVIVENNPVKFVGERDDVRRRETNLGNIISDLLYEYGQTGFTNPTDLAVINGGGVRVSVEEGPITRGNIISVLPFGNTMSQIQVTGKQLYAMFEHSLRTDVEKNKAGEIVKDSNDLPRLGSNGGFLQVSHSVQVYFDAMKEAGKRVWDLKILNPVTKTFEKVLEDKVYNLATNDFLAAGGDGYDMLGGLREEGPSMDEVVMEYLKKMTAEQLEKYAEAFPNTRIMQQVQAAEEPTEPEEEVPVTPAEPEEETPTVPAEPEEEKPVNPTEPETESEEVPAQEELSKEVEHQTYVAETRVASVNQLPETGEAIGFSFGIGLLFLAVGLWSIKRKKESSN